MTESNRYRDPNASVNYVTRETSEPNTELLARPKGSTRGEGVYAVVGIAILCGIGYGLWRWLS